MTGRHIWLTVGAMATVGASCSGGTAQPAPRASTPTSATSACQGIPGLPDNFADHGRAPASGAEPSIQIGDSFFVPTCLDDVAEGSVSLVVRNTGQRLHNVSIPDQGIDSDVAAGQTITLAVKIGTAPVAYFCKYHRTSGMAGALLHSGS